MEREGGKEGGRRQDGEGWDTRRQVSAFDVIKARQAGVRAGRCVSPGTQGEKTSR